MNKIEIAFFQQRLSRNSTCCESFYSQETKKKKKKLMEMFTPQFFSLYLKNFWIRLSERKAQLHSTRRCTYVGFWVFCCCCFYFWDLSLIYFVVLLSITSAVRKEFELKTPHLIYWKRFLKWKTVFKNTLVFFRMILWETPGKLKGY